MNTSANFRAVPLAVAWAINSLAYSIIYPFIPIYLNEERGIPIEKVGLIFPLMGLAVILTPPLSGWLTDRIGRRFMMQFGQSSRALVFLIMAAMAYWKAPFELFAIVLMINAGVGTFFQVAADSYLSEFTTPETRPAAYSKIRIGTNVGWALGPMLGAFLARTPFALMFAITAILCLIGALYTKYTCPQLPEPQASEHHAAPQLGLRQILANNSLLKLLAASFLLFILTSQLYSILSVYATQTVGVSRNTLGFVYSVNGFTIILFQLPVTRLLDRFKLHQAVRLLGGSILYALGYFSLAFCGGGFSLGVAVFVLTQGEVIVQPGLYTLVSRLAPKGGMGRSMAMLGLVRGIGMAAGPWIGAQAFASFAGAPVMLWGMLSIFAVVAGFAFLSLRSL